MKPKGKPIGRTPPEVKTARGGSEAPSQSMALKPPRAMGGEGKQDQAMDRKLGIKENGRKDTRLDAAAMRKAAKR